MDMLFSQFEPECESRGRVIFADIPIEAGWA